MCDEERRQCHCGKTAIFKVRSRIGHMKTICKNTCRRDLRIVCLNYFLEEDMDNANDQPYWQSLMMEVGKEDEVYFHWKRTKVVDITSNVRQMKWSWAGHINRLKDDRWASRVTT